jgi:hypothetical protein
MNDENNIENINNKIKKLLNLSKSDNENEAYIALTKANKLISEYKLDKDSLRFESVHAKSTKTYMPYRTIIANTVAWLYSCYHYINDIKKIVVFVGENPFSFLAGEMFSYLINTINRCALKAIHKNSKRNYRLSFKYGMADRICDRIFELGQSCSWAPYRYNKIEEAKNFIVRTTKLESVKRNKIKLNPTATRKGILYGNSVSLERQAGYTPVLQIQ